MRQSNKLTAPFITSIFAKQDKQRQPLSLYVQGTNFQTNVWRALLQIPSGQLITYGNLATMIGNQKASRAVGHAVGANPIAFLIPCHRVILVSGAIGNYRWGHIRKRAILGWEALKTEQYVN